MDVHGGSDDNSHFHVGSAPHRPHSSHSSSFLPLPDDVTNPALISPLVFLTETALPESIIATAIPTPRRARVPSDSVAAAAVAAAADVAGDHSRTHAHAHAYAHGHAHAQWHGSGYEHGEGSGAAPGTLARSLSKGGAAAGAAGAGAGVMVEASGLDVSLVADPALDPAAAFAAVAATSAAAAAAAAAYPDNTGAGAGAGAGTGTGVEADWDALAAAYPGTAIAAAAAAAVAAEAEAEADLEAGLGSAATAAAATAAAAAGINSKELAPPADSLDVYLALFLLTGAVVFPFKAAVTAGDFFNLEWPGKRVVFYAPSVSAIASPIVQAGVAHIFSRCSYTRILTVSAAAGAALLVGLPFLRVLVPAPTASFVAALLVLLGVGLVGSAMQTTTVTLASALPPVYVQGAVEGMAWSGLAAVAVHVAIKAAMGSHEGEEGEQALRLMGRLYFATGALILLAATANFMRVRRHPLLLYYAGLADKDPDVAGSLAAHRVKQEAAVAAAAAGAAAGAGALEGPGAEALAAVASSGSLGSERGLVPSGGSSLNSDMAAPEAHQSTKGKGSGWGTRKGKGKGKGDLAEPLLSLEDDDDSDDHNVNNTGRSGSGIGKAPASDSAAAAATAAAAAEAEAEAVAEQTQVLLKPSVLRAARAHPRILAHCFLIFAGTFFCYPAMFVVAPSPWKALADDWYSLLIVAVYFVFDVVGRNSARHVLCVTASWLPYLTIPRLLICPFFVLLNYTSFIPPVLGLPGSALIALSNGHLAGRVFMIAPALVPATLRPSMGAAMSVALALGVLTGSLIALGVSTVLG